MDSRAKGSAHDERTMRNVPPVMTPGEGDVLGCAIGTCLRLG